MTKHRTRCHDRAREYAIENFFLDTGIDGYDLPFSYDDDGETHAWDDVTAATPFQAWYRLMEATAGDYLANEDIACDCADDGA